MRGLGSIISGEPAVVHHCVGASARHKKISIGHEFIIPLTDIEHKDLHSGKWFGFSSRKEFEKASFARVLDLLHLQGAHEALLINSEIEDAIMGYHL